MSAIVSCVFKILSVHPSTSQEMVDLSTRIVTKAQTIRSNALDVVLYDSAKFFVEKGLSTKEMNVAGVDVSDNKIPSSASSGGALATELRASAGESSAVNGLERFEPLAMAVFASPLEPWRQPERTRKSRVELAATLSRQSLQDPAALAAILGAWLVEERSRPLREIIEGALEACMKQL